MGKHRSESKFIPASLLVPFRNDTLSRLASLEAGGGAIDIEIGVTGSGNAVTGVSKSGDTLTFAKSSTFALSTHNHTIAQVTGLQGALDLKAPLASVHQHWGAGGACAIQRSQQIVERRYVIPVNK